MRRKQVHVQRVVMRFERPRRRAPGDLLHHRRFHFEVAALVKELAQSPQHLGALDEDFAGIEVA